MTPEEVSALHGLCFPHAPWLADACKDLMSRPTTRLLEAPHAVLIAQVIAPEAEILTLCVHPEARRTGLAGGLVQRLMSQAQIVFLEVAADNAPACALYRGLGFVQTGTRRGYYTRANGAKVDAVMMQYGLTSR